MTDSVQASSYAQPLAPGVDGCCTEHEDGTLCYPMVMVGQFEEQLGDFLDGLPTDRRIVFPQVIAPMFMHLLSERGFRQGTVRVGDEVYSGSWERFPRFKGECG